MSENCNYSLLSKSGSLKTVQENYYADDCALLEKLDGICDLQEGNKKSIYDLSKVLIEDLKSVTDNSLSIDNLLSVFKLSSDEGRSLMSLAEALLRVPDNKTRINLIEDKILGLNWGKFVSKDKSTTSNMLSLGILAADKILAGSKKIKIDGLVDVAISKSVLESMKIICRQFVLDSSIVEALKTSKKLKSKGYLFSYDMLGEGARTKRDAQKCFDNYEEAIRVVGKFSQKDKLDGVSIKISALHPKFNSISFSKSYLEILESLKKLCNLAMDLGVILIIDAEEADRLDFSLLLFESIIRDPKFSKWDGLGLAIQAYQKRAIYVVDFIHSLALEYKKRIPVRLVKGAYWDTEIKAAQEKGLDNYPVFKRKDYTDISYLACANKIIKNIKSFHPQFATHNANTIASIIVLVQKHNVDMLEIEFQRLYGMGETLYDNLLKKYSSVNVRVYAPVGEYKELLPYLVRRMLENGANSSFVNKVNDNSISMDELLKSPFDLLCKQEEFKAVNDKYIPSPRDIFGAERENSRGIDVSNQIELSHVFECLGKYKSNTAFPIISGKKLKNKPISLKNPSNLNEEVGIYHLATKENIDNAINLAYKVGQNWAKPEVRADILEKSAVLIEKDIYQFISLLVKEAGKTIEDAVSEVREAVDFCRYYAALVRSDFVEPTKLKGITGEKNELSYEGKGVFVCISPWNFPLAIFLGQVTAALAAGNTVVAKPAEQTPLVASKAVELLYAAGVPKEVLSFIPCRGKDLGEVLAKNTNVAGVAFTGSTNVGRQINKTLAERDGAIATFIAETGGLNAMIVDSTALCEQVVDDVVESAFSSAGQRCSALRLLYLQADIYDKTVEMISGAMKELCVGDSSEISTEVGPVIDDVSLRKLEDHEKYLYEHADLISKVDVNNKSGRFYGPCAFKLRSSKDLKEEVFGPILHVVKYEQKDLKEVLSEINNSGYGLTFGVHSRINAFAKKVSAAIRVGNVYVNRNTIGAIVGSQPFGGLGLSGTGPKAGGPNYLKRFSVEKVVSIDTTAAGGNASLYAVALD